MTKATRLSLLLVLSFALLTAFGCATTTTGSTPEGGSATAGSGIVDGDATKGAVVIEADRIYFEYDRYDLSQAAKNILNRKADVLKQFPNLQVKIEGHCDERGTEEYNLALGERRARAAYDYLIMMGVRPTQLSFISYGKLYPAVQGNDEAAWAKNRRDEFRATVVNN